MFLVRRGTYHGRRGGTPNLPTTTQTGTATTGTGAETKKRPQTGTAFTENKMTTHHRTDGLTITILQNRKVLQLMQYTASFLVSTTRGANPSLGKITSYRPNNRKGVAS